MHIKKILPWFWIVPHAAAVVILVYTLLLSGQTRFNTNLLDILPATSASSKPSAAAKSGFSPAAADRALGEKNGRQVIILAEHKDFDKAAEAAAALYDELLASNAFDSLTLYVDEKAVGEFSRYLFDYRYHLLDGETIARLEAGGAADIADEALADVYGAFNFVSLDNLADDPFLLQSRELQSYLSSGLLSSGSMSLRNNVLAAEYDGSYYVMLRGGLRSVSVAGGNDGVPAVYAAASKVQTARADGSRFIFSGVPFHSHESSASAQREITIISTVSMIIVLLMFLAAFRSPLPIICSVLAVGTSLLLSLAAALLFFREIHVLTFVFGTTLIGTCVDYSIHYFFHARHGGGVCDTRAKIFRSVTMSFVSSVLCFAALLFAPFAILKQFAVFSIGGLLSSYLTVMCMFPLTEKWIHPQKAAARRQWPGMPGRMRIAKKILLFALPLAAVIVIIANRADVRVENDIRGLYTMSGTLLENEKIATQVQNYGSSGFYFIVAGDTPEEILEHEEELRRRLDEEIADGSLGSYLAASMFVPSMSAQRRSWEAAAALMPLAEEQYAALGMPPEAAGPLRSGYTADETKYAVPGASLPDFVGGLISQIWIGEIGGRYYSCVMPLHVKDEPRFRALADGFPYVFFINKVADIGRDLDSLTRMMLLLFAAAYAAIAVLVKVFYPWKETLRICAVPFLLALETIAVLALAGIPLGFFSVAGFVLIFGLGLDYMFYTVPAKARTAKDGPSANDDGVTVRAIALSFATTALSFGSLALSGFTPVHVFGLTVFTGITAAFVAAMTAKNTPETCKNLTHVR